MRPSRPSGSSPSPYGALGLAIGTLDAPARPGDAPAEAPAARPERAVGER